MHDDREIHVVVSYVGNDPWKHPFRPTATVQEVKVGAMTKGFELEQSAAENYALQYKGADLPETDEIGSLKESPLNVELVLKKEPSKGI